MISETNELSLDAYTQVSAKFYYNEAQICVQHTVLDRPILGSKFSRKFNIHNCHSHLVSVTEGRGVYPNHPPIQGSGICFNWALKFGLYSGLYNIALLVSGYFTVPPPPLRGGIGSDLGRNSLKSVSVRSKE